MTFSLEIAVPGTIEARARGCTCPTRPGYGDGPLLVCGGHYFSVKCPVHRHAVQAEVQRLYGRPQ